MARTNVKSLKMGSAAINAEKSHDSSPEIITSELPYNPSSTLTTDSSGASIPKPLDDYPLHNKGYDGQLENGYPATEKSSIYDEVVELTPTEAFKRRVDGDESPFPEVQACVPTDDDPSIMINCE